MLLSLLLTVADKSEVAKLVSWLENRLIRLLEIEERKPLLEAGEGWDAAFAGYLRELECPLLCDEDGSDTAYNPTQLPDYLTWLVSQAVGCAYTDNAADIGSKAASELGSAGAASSSGSGASSSGAAPEPPVPAHVAALIHQLAALCHVASDSAAPLATLRAVQRVIRQRILPAVQAAADAQAEAAAHTANAGASASAGASSGAGGSTAASRRARMPKRPLTAAELLDGATFPLGFDTGHAVLNKAATILRMLYVADLRELQDAVTDIIITVQEYVADPRTDASLGQVGR